VFISNGRFYCGFLYSWDCRRPLDSVGNSVVAVVYKMLFFWGGHEFLSVVLNSAILFPSAVISHIDLGQLFLQLY
jgi:hypothetical protein